MRKKRRALVWGAAALTIASKRIQAGEKSMSDSIFDLIPGILKLADLPPFYSNRENRLILDQLSAVKLNNFAFSLRKPNADFIHDGMRVSKAGTVQILSVSAVNYFFMKKLFQAPPLSLLPSFSLFPLPFSTLVVTATPCMINLGLIVLISHIHDLNQQRNNIGRFKDLNLQSLLEDFVIITAPFISSGILQDDLDHTELLAAQTQGSSVLIMIEQMVNLAMAAFYIRSKQNPEQDVFHLSDEQLRLMVNSPVRNSRNRSLFGLDLMTAFYHAAALRGFINNKVFAFSFGLMLARIQKIRPQYNEVIRSLSLMFMNANIMCTFGELIVESINWMFMNAKTGLINKLKPDVVRVESPYLVMVLVMMVLLDEPRFIQYNIYHALNNIKKNATILSNSLLKSLQYCWEYVPAFRSARTRVPLARMLQSLFTHHASVVPSPRASAATITELPSAGASSPTVLYGYSRNKANHDRAHKEQSEVTASQTASQQATAAHNVKKSSAPNEKATQKRNRNCFGSGFGCVIS